MAEKLVNIMKKPKELIGGALQVFKGPDVQNLVESFTSEMTVVTEGLYDTRCGCVRKWRSFRLRRPFFPNRCWTAGRSFS